MSDCPSPLSPTEIAALRERIYTEMLPDMVKTVEDFSKKYPFDVDDPFAETPDDPK